MADLLIRDVDTAVHDELRRRAAVAGTSVQSYGSRVLAEHAARRPVSEWLEALDELPRHPDVSGADLVRAARDGVP